MTPGTSPHRRSLRDALGIALALAAPLVSLIYLAWLVFGLPFVPFDVFDWMTRVLPGGLITFGIDTMVQTLVALGFNLKDTAKLAEQMMAVAGYLVTVWVVATAFLMLVPLRIGRRGPLFGAAVGLLVGILLVPIVLSVYSTPEVGRLVSVLWILLAHGVWGAALGLIHVGVRPEPRYGEAAPPSEDHGLGETGGAGGPPAVPIFAETISRRKFILRVGGAAAVITASGAGVATYLRLSKEEPYVGPSFLLPNAGAATQPVPGTRLEYTPVPEHYRIDINTIPPNIDIEDWRLEIRGLVQEPLDISLEQLQTAYPPREQFVTLSCISNPVGGPLISTTLWTGARLSEVLETAGVLPEARFVHITSEDGFHETAALDVIRNDPRIMLTYSFDRQPLPQGHGSPLRVYIPNHYGMKQPKWIVGIELTADFEPGYWVERGWSREAIVNATSVIDTVYADGLERQNGSPVVPVGGIAYAGDRGISEVVVRMDDGPWEQAELREPLSGLTWVIWRYSWPFQPGQHTLYVRGRDGEGNWQVAESSDTYPDGATGLHAFRFPADYVFPEG